MLTRKPRIGEKIITKDNEVFRITRYEGNIAHILGVEGKYKDLKSTFIWQFNDGLNNYCTILEE